MEVDFSGFYGNEALCAALSARIRTNTASHAYCIEGPEGSGRKTLAFLLAAALSCEDETRVPCGRCSACRKIFNRQSPDLYTLGFPDEDGTRKTKTIGVDAVRSLREDVYIRPNDLERKLYIIDRTDTMTVQAQNALLKILEEPPETVTFFLICENRFALLPTVRSRVQTLCMERFSDEKLRGLLLEHEDGARALEKKKPERLSLFVRLADGAYGQALWYLNAQPKALSENPAYDAHESAERCLACLFPDGDEPPSGGKTALLGLLMKCADTRDRMRGLLDMLCAAVRDLTACVMEEEPGNLLFFADRERAFSIASLCDARRLWEVYRELSRLRASVDANPNAALLQNEVTTALNRLKN